VLVALLVTKIFGFWTSLAQALRFAVALPLPFVTVHWYRESGLSWLLSPWYSPFIERLPYRWGYWALYKKSDFSWAHKGNLPRKELESDVFGRQPQEDVFSMFMMQM
jgi:hypothetical protein